MDMNRRISVMVLGVVAAMSGLAAQAPGVAVNFSPKPIPGIEIAAEWRPEVAGDARVSVQLSKLTVGASNGLRKDERSAWWATVGYPLIRTVAWEYALSVEAGYGAVVGGDRIADRQLSLGVAAALNPEGIGAALIPWTAISYRHLWLGGLKSQSAAGVSLGIELRTAALLPKLGRLGGLSVYATVEAILPRGRAVQEMTRPSGGIGASYTLRR